MRFAVGKVGGGRKRAGGSGQRQLLSLHYVFVVGTDAQLIGQWNFAGSSQG